MTRLFGFECEVASGVRDVLTLLAADGLLPSARLHAYHCECDDCYHDPYRSNPLHAQEDCTVEGEIITKPLAYGSTEADRTIAGLAAAMSTGRGSPGEGAGFHVHVSHDDMEEYQKVLLYRLFVRYQNDLAELASGQWGGVRDYNAPLQAGDLVRTGPRTEEQWCNGGAFAMTVEELGGCSLWGQDSYYTSRNMAGYYCRGHRRQVDSGLPADAFWTADAFELVPHFRWTGKDQWLARRTNTFEFRLWNSTRAEWRMRLAVGVSVAMVEAAHADVNVTEHDGRTLVGVLAPFLDADTLAGVLRQAHYIEEVRNAA